MCIRWRRRGRSKVAAATVMLISVALIEPADCDIETLDCVGVHRVHDWVSTAVSMEHLLPLVVLHSLLHSTTPSPLPSTYRTPTRTTNTVFPTKDYSSTVVVHIAARTRSYISNYTTATPNPSSTPVLVHSGHNYYP